MFQGFARSGLAWKRFLMRKEVMNVELVHVQWLSKLFEAVESIFACPRSRYIFLIFWRLHSPPRANLFHFIFPEYNTFPLKANSKRRENNFVLTLFSCTGFSHWNPNRHWQSCDNMKIHKNKSNFGVSKYELEVNEMN